MNTHDKILAAALKVLEEEGGAQFSTRAVCAIAQVSAPTLYHHFGNADGLLSAAVVEAFRQFLESKNAAVVSTIPETALRQGWDDYVSFAATRPRLYAAMMGRLLEGAQIEAAEQAYKKLVQNIQEIAAEGQLALSVEAAADLAWASANAASLLHVTAQIRKAPPPRQSVVDLIREGTIQTILVRGQKDFLE
ncbi:TetR/AcrR family transcriptional regulator [Paenibacillus puerhi]|uniref:TetR/AcrR family transcriptional regulator n=1 Tax=Paenibacillus puerhi TaxID=2692622 RepID=UPI001359E789|nr:TetR/AcrR family transcriptional regulator [Paenibacillus puerhi]